MKIFKLGLKNIGASTYVYAQRSERTDKKVVTKSYSLGTIEKFIPLLNEKLLSGNVYTYSGEVCFTKLAEKIKFKSIVQNYFQKKQMKGKRKPSYDLSDYLLILAIYHILNRDSKSRCIEWFKRSYLQYMFRIEQTAFHKNNIYEYMDRFYKPRIELFRNLRDSAITLIGIDVSELIFDTTSVFFRVAEFTAEDCFRRRGHSRDHRPDLVQVILALCTNSEGFPLYYRAYPGNTSDFHAFKNFLSDFDREVKPLCKNNTITWVIFDKGSTSKETIARLDKMSEDISYLAYIASVKLYDWMFDKLEYATSCNINNREYKVAEFFTDKYNGLKRCLVVYDPKLKSKQVLKLQKKYQKVKSELDRIILQKGNNHVKCIAALSDVIRKHKLTKVFEVKIENKRVVYEENKAARDKLFMKARTFTIITNNFTSGKIEIVSYYIGRNKIEQIIRELKHDIPMRPFFHHLKRRIKTHGFIVMAGYLLFSGMKILLQKKGLSYTTQELLHLLRSGQIELIKWKDPITAEYPRNISPDLVLMFNKIGVPYPKTLF